MGIFFDQVGCNLKRSLQIFTHTNPNPSKDVVVDSIDHFEHVSDSQSTRVDPENNLQTTFRRFVSKNYSKNVISPFYKGISKEITYFKHKKRIFWISFNFSQSVLAEYHSYDFHIPGPCKLDVGPSPAQF